MTNDGLFYKSSGKFSPMIFLALPIMGVLVFVVTYIYAYINVYNPFIYVNLFLFLGICFLLSISTVMLITMIKSRNILVTTLFGGITGLTAVYFTWAMFIKVLFSRHNILPVEHDVFFMPPSVLLGYIKQVSDEGWYSIFDMTVSGVFLWVIWCIEALGLLLLPLTTAYGYATTTVFCEKCDQWATEDESVLVFTYPDEAELKQKFKAQNLRFLDKAKQAKEDDTEFYQVDCEWCEQCEELHTLSLRKVTRSWDDEGDEELSQDTIYEDMYIRKQTHSDVFKAAEEKGFGVFLEVLKDAPESDAVDDVEGAAPQEA